MEGGHKCQVLPCIIFTSFNLYVLKPGDFFSGYLTLNVNSVAVTVLALGLQNEETQFLPSNNLHGNQKDCSRKKENPHVYLSALETIDSIQHKKKIVFKCWKSKMDTLLRNFTVSLSMYESLKLYPEQYPELYLLFYQQIFHTIPDTVAFTMQAGQWETGKVLVISESFKYV